MYGFGVPEFIVLVIGLVALWMYAGSRGRLTVRAFIYLSELSAGRAEEEANKTALSVDSNAASKFSSVTRNYVKMFYGGKQLDLISEARLKGFRG